MVYAPLVAHVVLKMLFPGDLQMGELLKDPVDMGLWITLVAYCLEAAAWSTETLFCLGHFSSFSFEKSRINNDP